MRRKNNPFNGNRYVLNKATGEIHDLDNEYPSCHIDKINKGNILNCMSYEDAYIRALALCVHRPNGCYFCMPSKDNG